MFPFEVQSEMNSVDSVHSSFVGVLSCRKNREAVTYWAPNVAKRMSTKIRRGPLMSGFLMISSNALMGEYRTSSTLRANRSLSHLLAGYT